jgi:acetyltransferase-like isoleucine patch superfamily enzyme
MSIKKKLSVIKKDFRGVVFFALSLFFTGLNSIISTKITSFICLLKNIKIGRNNKFYGIPILDRKPLSTIILGNNCRIRSDITTNLARRKKCILRTFNADAYIEVKDNTGINGSVIASSERIVIGKDVLIGYNCYISDTDNHPIDPIERHTGKAESAPINIGDNVWLGANVVVLKGVSIGENSVIGANSLVLSSIPANVLAIGNPCRVIKKI